MAEVVDIALSASVDTAVEALPEADSEACIAGRALVDGIASCTIFYTALDAGLAAGTQTEAGLAG